MNDESSGDQRHKAHPSVDEEPGMSRWDRSPGPPFLPRLRAARTFCTDNWNLEGPVILSGTTWIDQLRRGPRAGKAASSRSSGRVFEPSHLTKRRHDRKRVWMVILDKHAGVIGKENGRVGVVGALGGGLWVERLSMNGIWMSSRSGSRMII